MFRRSYELATKIPHSAPLVDAKAKVAGDMILIETKEKVKLPWFCRDTASGFEVPFQYVSKLPHELVCAQLNMGKSDMPLKDIMIMDDYSDRLTPDFISPKGTGWHVIEVKTTKGPTHDDHLELLKYFDPLESRVVESGQDIELSLIRVGNDGIVTDVPVLPVRDIMLAYSLGQSSIAAVESLGLRVKEVEESEEIWNAISLSVQTHKAEPIDDILDSTTIKHCNCSTNHTYEWAKPYTSPQMPKSRGSNMTEKAIVQVPFFTVKKGLIGTKNMIKQIKDIFRSERTALTNLWTSVLSNVTPAKLKLIDTTEDLTDSNAYYGSHAFQEKSKVSSRFLLERDWNELALDGLEAKSHLGDPALQEKRKAAKEPFSNDVTTDDIDQFVLRDEFPSVSQVNSIQAEIDQTVDSTLTYDVNAHLVNNFLNGHVRMSFWYQAGIILHRIMAELNYLRTSHVNQHEFIVRKLHDMDVILLIKTTRKDGPIFFSVCAKVDKYIKTTVFKQPLEKEGYMMTEFVSVDHHKISQYLYAHAKLASLYSVAHYSDKAFSKRSTEDLSLFKVMLLAFLEDKEKTSIDLLLFRYMYMEMLTYRADPFKLLSKFDDAPRSRLQIWIRKRFYITAISMMKHSKGKPLKPTEMLSWITLTPAKTFEKVLLLSYLGVIHNKMEGNQTHGFRQIFMKVIKEEIALRDAKQECISGNECAGDTLKSHEFCPAFVRKMGGAVKTYLEKHTTVLTDNTIISELAKVEWEYFATLKVSAKNLMSDIYDPTTEDERRRVKCVQAVYSLMTEYNVERPFMCIGKIAADTRATGENLANLFKKQQHGGTREIFVLTMRWRITIHFLERIMRVIGELLPGEMLTKPHRKHVETYLHYSKSYKNLTGSSQELYTVISSNDAATWAQKFVMPMFSIFTDQFLPAQYIEISHTIYNLHTTKFLELPVSLLRSFFHTDDSDVLSAELLELRAQFLGLSEQHDLIESNGIILKNRSNMMMGILHYTSSVYAWALCYLSVILMKLVLPPETTITFKVSSDDSSILMSCPINPQDELTKAKMRSVICLVNKTYPMAGCKISHEKSTQAVDVGVEEFNSKWMVRTTTLSVPLKFSLTAVNLPQSSNLEDRFRQFVSSRQQMISEGCGILLTAIIGRLQGCVHYSSLGIDSLHLGHYYLQQLKLVNHPTLGWYILEPTLCSGVIPPNILKAYHVWRSPVAQRVEKVMHKKYYSYHMQEQNPMSRLHIAIGKSARYQGMLEDMNIDKDSWISWLDDPSLLYRRSKTWKEAALLVAGKAFAAGVPDSFNFNDSAETHRASVYVWTGKCFDFEFEDNREKSSLMDVLTTILNGLADSKTMDELELLLYAEIHPSVHSLLDMFGSTRFKLAASSSRRSCNQTVTFSNETLFSRVSLQDCTNFLWFQLPVKRSRSEIIEAWSRYKQVYTWLDMDYKTSLEASGFENHVQMANFVKSVSIKSFSIQFLGLKVEAPDMRTKLRNLIMENAWRSEKFVAMEDEDESSVESVDFFSSLNLVLSSSSPQLYMDMFLRYNGHVLKKYETRKSLDSLSQNERIGVLACQIMRNGPQTVEDILSFLVPYALSYRDVIGRRQALCIKINMLSFIVYYDKNVVQRIEADSYRSIMNYSNELLQLLRKNHLNISTKKKQELREGLDNNLMLSTTNIRIPVTINQQVDVSMRGYQATATLEKGRLVLKWFDEELQELARYNPSMTRGTLVKSSLAMRVSHPIDKKWFGLQELEMDEFLEAMKGEKKYWLLSLLHDKLLLIDETKEGELDEEWPELEEKKAPQPAGAHLSAEEKDKLISQLMYTTENTTDSSLKELATKAIETVKIDVNQILNLNVGYHDNLINEVMLSMDNSDVVYAPKTIQTLHPLCNKVAQCMRAYRGMRKMYRTPDLEAIYSIINWAD